VHTNPPLTTRDPAPQQNLGFNFHNGRCHPPSQNQDLSGLIFSPRVVSFPSRPKEPFGAPPRLSGLFFEAAHPRFPGPKTNTPPPNPTPPPPHLRICLEDGVVWPSAVKLCFWYFSNPASPSPPPHGPPLLLTTTNSRGNYSPPLGRGATTPPRGSYPPLPRLTPSSLLAFTEVTFLALTPSRRSTARASSFFLSSPLRRVYEIGFTLPSPVPKA